MSAMTLRWFTELRQATRSLARAPGFTVVAVIVLGIGIGVTTAVYAVVKQVLIDPLGYPDADRLVVLLSEVPGYGAGAEWGASTAQYFHFRQNAVTLGDIGALGFRSRSVALEGSETFERAQIGLATAGVHRMIGARALLGRPLAETDDIPGSPATAVVSKGFWQNRLGGDTQVVGKALHFYGEGIGSRESSARIIGVVEPVGEALADDVDIWLPNILDPAGPHYNNHNLIVIAKRKSGTALVSAQAEIDSLTQSLPEAYPQAYGAEQMGDFMERFGFRSRLRDFKTHVVGDAAVLLQILLGAAALLAVVAWANIACLMLARAEVCRRDVSVRIALGAAGAAAGRHFAAQNVVVVFAGGLVGLVVAWWLCAFLVASPVPMPRLDQVAIDAGVAAFAVALSVGVGLALVAVLVLAARGSAGALPDAGRGATAATERLRARSGLIAGQMALAMVLIVAAGFLVASFLNLSRVDPGIEPDGVVRVSAYPRSGYADHASWWHLLRQAETRIEALPGVSVAGSVSSLPFATGGCVGQSFRDPAVAERMSAAELTSCTAQDIATPGYFEAMGIPLLRGRTLDMADLDDPTRGSAVVSRTFAERYWPGENPLGKQLAPHGRGEPWYTVVGLVGDVFAGKVTEPPTAHVYYPVVQIPGEAGWYGNVTNIVARTELAEPTVVLPQMRAILAELDPGIAVEKPGTMREVLDQSLSDVRLMFWLLAVSALAALTLAILGVYGVVAFLVARRSTEIGIRIALGAAPVRVRRMMVIETLKPLAVGLLLGLAASLAAGQALRGVLFGVTAANVLMYVGAAAALAAATALASWLAAGRASRITPMDALRME